MVSINKNSGLGRASFQYFKPYGESLPYLVTKVDGKRAGTYPTNYFLTKDGRKITKRTPFDTLLKVNLEVVPENNVDKLSHLQGKRISLLALGTDPFELSLQNYSV